MTTAITVARIAETAAVLLGHGWSAQTSTWGSTADFVGPDDVNFSLSEDSDGDLVIGFDRDAFRNIVFPEGVEVFHAGAYLPLATPSDGLEALAKCCADVIRALTNH